MVFILLFISRLLIVLVDFVAKNTIPYLGFFPYKELLVEFGLPSWISSSANFDGIHYLQIAKQGYSQWEQAFFPLFPLLIKIVSFIIPNFLVASLLISNICFAVGLIFFNKLLKIWGVKTAWPLILLLSFPTAFYFGIVYTEGLFFMLFVLSLYNLEKKNYWIAALFAALSSATRLIGIFLIIPFFFQLLSEGDILIKNYKLKIKHSAILLIAPLLGLLSYMFYLWSTTGDPLFFFNSQPIFGANRSTHLILLPQVYYRYLKILFTATHDFQWALSLFEMTIFSFVLIVLLLDLLKILKPILRPLTHLRGVQAQKHALIYGGLGLNLFSLINIILPTLTGTFSSIPRYALFSLSFFLYLGSEQSRAIKISLFIVFTLMQIVLLSFFVQGYFVG